MRYSVYEGEGARYSTKTREFGSLRGAAEFARELPSPDDFLGIQAVDYGELTPQEKAAFALFADGKVVL